MNEEEILEFIKVFNSESNVDLFTNCACYYFAVILKSRLGPFADICYNPSSIHFTVYHYPTHKYYDITGVVDGEGYVDWHSYKGVDFDLIYKTCVLFKS